MSAIPCPHCGAKPETGGHSTRKRHCDRNDSCAWTTCKVCKSYWGRGDTHSCGGTDIECRTKSTTGLKEDQ